jgi:hypothetical protein
MSCDTDIDPLLADVTADALMVQVCIRRLYTRKGSLLSDPTANTLDVRDFLSGSIADGDLPRIQALCSDALLDDQRIFTADVVAKFNTVTRVLTLRIVGTGATGPFSLTLAVTNVTVQLLVPV